MSFFQKLFTSPHGMLKVSIAFCYVILGVYLYINSTVLRSMINITGTYILVLSMLFIAYGAYRLYRAVNDMRHE